jgi:hypothetical protein
MYGRTVLHYLPIVIANDENLYRNIFLGMSLRVSQLKFAGRRQDVNVLWDSWLGRKRVRALISSDGNHGILPNPSILNRTSLRRLGREDCDSNAQTLNSLSLTACNFKSSIKEAAIKLD